jgi:hypothetical protein
VSPDVHGSARDQEKWAPVFRPITRKIQDSDHGHFRSLRSEVTVILGPWSYCPALGTSIASFFHYTDSNSIIVEKIIPIVASGIPTVIFGPGSIAQAHSLDEYVEIAQVTKAARMLVDAARR